MFTDLIGTPLAFGFGGPTDIAIIAVVVLVLFGGSKIGPLMKSFGDGVREFKKATKEDDAPAATTTTTVTASKDEEK